MGVRIIAVCQHSRRPGTPSEGASAPPSSQCAILRALQSLIIASEIS